MTDLYKLFDIEEQIESIHTNKKVIESFFPVVKNLGITNSWRGLMPFSPDGKPIAGKIDCVPGNLYINTGLASAGIMKGFGVGQMLAKLMVDPVNNKKQLLAWDPNRCVRPTKGIYS